MYLEEALQQGTPSRMYMYKKTEMAILSFLIVVPVSQFLSKVPLISDFFLLRYVHFFIMEDLENV